MDENLEDKEILDFLSKKKEAEEKKENKEKLK